MENICILWSGEVMVERKGSDIKNAQCECNPFKVYTHATGCHRWICLRQQNHKLNKSMIDLQIES